MPTAYSVEGNLTSGKRVKCSHNDCGRTLTLAHLCSDGIVTGSESFHIRGTLYRYPAIYFKQDNWLIIKTSEPILVGRSNIHKTYYMAFDEDHIPFDLLERYNRLLEEQNTNTVNLQLPEHSEDAQPLNPFSTSSALDSALRQTFLNGVRDGIQAHVPTINLPDLRTTTSAVDLQERLGRTAEETRRASLEEEMRRMAETIANIRTGTEAPIDESRPPQPAQRRRNTASGTEAITNEAPRDRTIHVENNNPPVDVASHIERLREQSERAAMNSILNNQRSNEVAASEGIWEHHRKGGII